MKWFFVLLAVISVAVSIGLKQWDKAVIAAADDEAWWFYSRIVDSTLKRLDEPAQVGMALDICEETYNSWDTLKDSAGGKALVAKCDRFYRKLKTHLSRSEL